LLLAFAVSVAAAAAFLLQATLTREESRLRRHESKRARAAALVVARRLESEPAARARDWTTAATSLAAEVGYRVTLVDSSGAVLGDSETPPGNVAALPAERARVEIRRALEGKSTVEVRWDSSAGGLAAYAAAPVERPRHVAAARVSTPMDAAEAERRALGRLALELTAAAIALAALFGWILTRRLRARAVALERFVRRLAARDFGAPPVPAGRDEWTPLADGLQRFASEMETQLSALERERDQRELILAHMTDGVALLDAEGRVVHGNSSLASILGMPQPPAPGARFLDYTPLRELADLLADAEAAAHTLEVEIRMWTPHQRVVRASASRLERAGRASVLLVLHDLTEVELLNRVRQDFVANVSHELKTPLTSVRGYAETLLEGGLDDAARREGFVRVIHEQATKLGSLVDDLLSLAELERPGAHLRPESLDLREAIERHAASFRGRATRAQIELSVEPGPPAPVVADRARIDQVIANLLDNALKYTEHGRVVLRACADTDRVWCEVEDSGPGIPEEDQARIFERFYRVDKARSRELGGTGLGLAIVKHVLSLHGGTVSVRSRLGHGSIFRFELPRRSPAMPAG
jgi:two-component system phosphate regulon sensor histidine kinase PhoR